MGDTSDLDQQIEQLRKCEVIKESDVKILCAKAREILGMLLKQTLGILSTTKFSSWGEQRAESRFSGDGVRRHPRPVLRSQGTLQGDFEILVLAPGWKSILTQVGGDVPDTNYLFMGDFVDRGFYSVETFLLLLALKVLQLNLLTYKFFISTPQLWRCVTPTG